MMTSLNTRRIARMTLSGFFALCFSFFLHHSVQASPKTSKNTPPKADHPVTFAGDERLPESLKENKRNQQNEQEENEAY
jgi:hypothetical protein